MSSMHRFFSVHMIDKTLYDLVQDGDDTVEDMSTTSDDDYDAEELTEEVEHAKDVASMLKQETAKVSISDSLAEITWRNHLPGASYLI